MSSKEPSSKDSKSSIDSGVTNKTYASKVLGGYPSEKGQKEIDRQNSPAGRKRAPGSVRV
jgi:hypothetical protein